MKKQASINGLVTKVYLDRKVLPFVTKSYLDKRLRPFVTKSYLDRKLRQFEGRLDWKIEDTIENTLETKTKSLHDKFDELFKRLDWFTGKYDKLDKEQILLSGKVSQTDDRLEKVEKHVGIAN